MKGTIVLNPQRALATYIRSLGLCWGHGGALHMEEFTHPGLDMIHMTNVMRMLIMKYYA